MTHPLTTLINSLLFFISWQRIADKLTEQRTTRKQLSIYLIASISLQFLMATAIKEVPVLYDLFHHTMLWAPTAFTIQGLLMWALLYRQVHPPRAISAISLAYFFFYGLMILFDVMLIEPVYFHFLAQLSTETQQFWLFNLNIIVVHLGALFGSFLVGAVIEKVQFAKYYAGLFTGKLRCTAICLISLLLMHSLQVITWIFPALENESWYYFAFSILDLVALFFILFVAVFETNREKVKNQEAFITQQQIYVQSLEGLQQELRTFRHDYQNLLSGLYLSAREGDSETLQETLRSTLGYFDDRLGQQIRRVTELSRIQIPEIKSLLLVKLMQADEANLTIQLEIPSPVTQLNMNTNDFLRCLGILIDNALEAASALAEPPATALTIALLQDEKGLLLIVANPCAEAIPLPKLTQPGYTTKGAGRGTGLTSYQRIVQRYAHAVSSTSCENSVFRQTLQIRRPS